jgi:putative ABC transport system ATP-binding protein
MIQVENLGKVINGPAQRLTILDNISFSINAAESVAIVGVSGSGKSTLLGLMAGLDLPSHGRVCLDGADLNQLDEDGRARVRHQRVGFVFQSFQLLPGLTALENVLLPLELNGTAGSEQMARDWLQQVGLKDRIHHYPNQLSGGEQQRVAIARAFVGGPKILFADEPTGNLDQTTAAQIIELLFRLNTEEGTTLVIVTHDENIADRCLRRLTLAGGRLQDST